MKKRLSAPLTEIAERQLGFYVALVLATISSKLHSKPDY
jgi:hypothetical protein